MAGVFKKALNLLVGDPSTVNLKMPKRAANPYKTYSERELIQLESKIGAELFGAIPAGNRREFFCLDASTWIWYEEWIDVDSGKRRASTTRYEIHDNGILKVQEGSRYTFLEGSELENLVMAIELYHERVGREIYGKDPKTGLALAR